MDSRTCFTTPFMVPAISSSREKNMHRVSAGWGRLQLLPRSDCDGDNFDHLLYCFSALYPFRSQARVDAGPQFRLSNLGLSLINSSI